MKFLTVVIIFIGTIILFIDLVASLYFIGGIDFLNGIHRGGSQITPTPFPTLSVNQINNFNNVKLNNNTVKITDNYYISPEEEKVWSDLLANIPKNPDKVIATASANGKIVELESGKPYSFSTVTFSWSGEKAIEPGTKIVGFYVYFGPNSTEIPFPEEGYEKSVDPKIGGRYIIENYYTATNLKKGNEYNLYIQAVSDSKNENPYYRVGMEQVGYLKTLSAKRLFNYKSE